MWHRGAPDARGPTDMTNILRDVAESKQVTLEHLQRPHHFHGNISENWVIRWLGILISMLQRPVPQKRVLWLCLGGERITSREARWNRKPTGSDGQLPIKILVIFNLWERERWTKLIQSILGWVFVYPEIFRGLRR